MDTPDPSDTVYWIRRLHETGNPPVAWYATLSIKRPRILNFEFEDVNEDPDPHEWPVELS